MDNSTTKIAVIAVVAILIIAAVGFVIAGDNGSDEGVTSKTAGLPVYGNANEDMTIDAEDKKIIENILDKKEGYTFTAYPFADANYDQRVDAEDLKIVEKIINDQKTTIYHYSYFNDGGMNVIAKVVDSQWPVDNAIVNSNTNLTTMMLLGLQDKVCASSDKSSMGYYDPELLGFLNDDGIIAMGDMASSMVDNVNNVMDRTGTYTMIIDGYPPFGTDYTAEVEALGCDVIKMCESNPVIEDVLASTLLMGFLFQAEERAQELTKLYANIWDGILDVASGITDNKVKFTTGLALESNQHTFKATLAGGEYAFKGTDAPVNTWGSGYEMGDWIYKYKIDCFMEVSWGNSFNGSFFDKNGPNAASLLNSVAKYKDLDCYKADDFYCIAAGTPIVLDTLIRGYTMYPEQYQNLYTESMDKFYELLGENSHGEKFSDLGLDLIFSISELEKLAEKQKA